MARHRRPSALRHGLTSRTVREEWSRGALELAEALIGAAPREPQVLEAARDAAEAILYLRRVQQCRLLLLEDGALQRCTPTEAGRDLALRLSGAVKGADTAECRPLREGLRVAHDREWIVGFETLPIFFLGDEIRGREEDLRRLADYERRAHSRRRKQLRRLDYERVEAERRRVAAAAHPKSS